MKVPLGVKGIVTIVVASVLTLIIATGAGIGMVAFARQTSLFGAGAPPPAPTTADPAAQTLGLPTAAQVLDEYNTAVETKDERLFALTTCASFVTADMKRRGMGSVQDLLAAYERAKKFVPVQFVENIEARSAGNTGTDGWVKVMATITDNRVIPPSQERREVTMKLVYEESRWKLCPSLDPL